MNLPLECRGTVLRADDWAAQTLNLQQPTANEMSLHARHLHPFPHWNL